MFYDEWADVLERTSAYAGCIIVGDVNLHVDDVANTSTERFLTLLTSFGLRDYAGRPTRGDHQLDAFVSRSDQPAPVVKVAPPLISDHSLIVALFEVTDYHPARTSCRHVVKRRPWRSFNLDAFATDLEESELVRNPPSDVIQLFDSYNCTLADLLDKHAPLRDVKIRARPTAP